MNFRIGNGYDVHALAEGETLWLGGILIEHYKGTVAHSDGDVLIHAVCDAMLGALALGDIGQHFPDTDQNFKNIDSKLLLKKCCELIIAEGYQIANIDSTICAQKPKLMPHLPAMRKCMAEILNIDINQVSIKATTTEKLGFVGREEGISSYAVILLQKIQ
ncbi:MAG TPA: 2-C-methyl-D-erythritol 2,4-cyclodiphosphate synthase [Prolixibacteraceae bacterium]|nr:2-C-methyl-D-erythritol 2,4-cyclodiphosphate synthase [Prolixibacteraceae bacterium]HPR60003.1 2-C-methyl-D-erythritol 2,4-cyclodiphosphate synthase [Prolixibacteraceae bacterium]